MKRVPNSIASCRRRATAGGPPSAVRRGSLPEGPSGAAQQRQPANQVSQGSVIGGLATPGGDLRQLVPGQPIQGAARGQRLATMRIALAAGKRIAQALGQRTVIATLPRQNLAHSHGLQRVDHRCIIARRAVLVKE